MTMTKAKMIERLHSQDHELRLVRESNVKLMNDISLLNMKIQSITAEKNTFQRLCTEQNDIINETRGRISILREITADFIRNLMEAKRDQKFQGPATGAITQTPTKDPGAKLSI